MRLVVYQALFLGTYLLFLTIVRQWARGHTLRRAEEERERRAALEREWRVGIPTTPIRREGR